MTAAVDYTKYSYFPIESPLLEEYYQKQKNTFWIAQEIDYSADRYDWEKLDEDTKNFVKFILFFFAQADGIINENLIRNFTEETSVIKEAGKFYTAQQMCEVGHNETYSLLIESLIRDPKEKEMAYNAIHHFPSIGAIKDWMFKWMDRDIPLAERIIAFACVEGILFSSAFCGIYWIKKRNILPALCKANEFIARDEALHTEFGVALYHVFTSLKKICDKVPEHRAHAIIKEAVGVAENFTRSALKVELVGMNADDMIKYVKCTADRLLVSLGFSKYFNEKNPFDWMAVIGLPNKTNFFESRVTEYAREGTQSSDSSEFNLDADF